MDNYDYCVQWAINHKAAKTNYSVIDYGCGSGIIVEKLIANNVEAFGCDVFYDGGDYSKKINNELFEKSIIRRMHEGLIPFPDNSFDLVINNQVMEHVEDLDQVLAEIHRVLKPDGIVLSLFPDKWVWREGHSGVPFLHWFPKKSNLRIHYAAAIRSLGFGYHRGNKSIYKWSTDFCEWLDLWTHYRSPDVIYNSYNRYFDEITHIEDDFVQKRGGVKFGILKLLPREIQMKAVRRLGSAVFYARRRGQTH